MDLWFPGAESCLLIAAVVLFFLYLYTSSSGDFWADHGVPTTPYNNFFMTALKILFSPDPLAISHQKMYNSFAGKRYVGTHIFGKPALFVRDPETVQQFLVKEFSTFYNRSLNMDPNLPTIEKTLLTVQNSEWKCLRTKLNPAFTSGQMKTLFQELSNTCDYLVKHMSKYSRTGEPLEMKTTMSRFIVYSIGSVAFGLTLNTLEDPDCKFAKMGGRLTRPIGGLLSMIAMVFPAFIGHIRRAMANIKHWTGMEEDYRQFFKEVVSEVMEYREKNNVKKNDYLNILINLHKQDVDSTDEIKFDMDMVTSSAMVFILAGQETSASTLSFMLYELAANQNVQDRLLEELLQVLKKYDGVPTYEAVKEMKYLDQVLSETLRLYPPIPATFRNSTRPYQIPGTSIVLPTGTMVSVSLFSLQRDPEYFPDPDTFNPNRFAEDANIVKGSYLPFGDGPRICIGQRLAQLQVKLTLIKVLLSYKLTVDEKTKTPITFANQFMLSAVGGIWLNVHPRN